MSTSKMSHRTAVAVGLIVLLAVAIVWTVVDGAGADSTTIGAVLAHQDTAWVSVGLTLPVVETRGFSVLRGLPSGTDIVL